MSYSDEMNEVIAVMAVKLSCANDCASRAIDALALLKERPYLAPYVGIQIRMLADLTRALSLLSAQLLDATPPASLQLILEQPSSCSS